MTAPDKSFESKLLESWQANAELWTSAIREGKIQSRETTTHAAIQQAILAFSPNKALDLGCGEGWLIRSLANQGIEWVGVEGVPALAEKARESGKAEILTLNYAALVAEPHRCGGGFDLVVANFSLLEAELLPLFLSLRKIVTPGARILIQTLHPCTLEGPYLSGPRSESFAAMGSGTWQTMPWYFRTLGDWLDLLRAADLKLLSLCEPLLPETLRPASLILEVAF